LGLYQPLQALLEIDSVKSTINAIKGELANTLQAASLTGTEEIVQLLLDNGADVNAQGEEYGNPLQAISYQGSE
jgi:ankyrin repeat protein